jgi:uncharacterized protein YbdZ (MbtH family)
LLEDVVTTPFVDRAADFVVLVDERRQCALWSPRFGVAAGWPVAVPAAGQSVFESIGADRRGVRRNP